MKDLCSHSSGTALQVEDLITLIDKWGVFVGGEENMRDR
jgi:hypothetical protein